MGLTLVLLIPPCKPLSRMYRKRKMPFMPLPGDVVSTAMHDSEKWRKKIYIYIYSPASVTDSFIFLCLPASHYCHRFHHSIGNKCKSTMYFLVQSAERSPAYLTDRSLEFLKDFRQQLAGLSTAKLRQATQPHCALTLEDKVPCVGPARMRARTNGGTCYVAGYSSEEDCISRTVLSLSYF